MSDAPKLLVEWSSPWQEFRTALRPALQRSAAPLAGEARTGLFPYSGILVSWVAEAALLVAIIVLPSKLARFQPQLPPATPTYDVIYFSGDELPQVEDNGGARAGRSGRGGGQHSHHRTQVIRVARGESPREQVVDVPKLKLPLSNSAVANLLAYKPIPGPAPAEGLKSSSRAPNVMESVVPPTPEVQREKTRALPATTAAVVPPAVAAPQRDLIPVRIPGAQAVAVVPPPVSAPEAVSNSHPKLTLPPPAVVAPAPMQVARDIRSGPGFGAGELQKQIVPPPVQLGSAASERRGIGGVSNPSVVPPPVQLNGASTGNRTVAGLENTSIVPPPVQAGTGLLQRRPIGSLGAGTPNVVAPAPTILASSSSLGRGNRGNGLGGPLDAGSVAAPPSNAGGGGNGTGVVVSDQPGAKIAVPGNGGAGSLAMSPAGGAKAGLGGSGGGSGIVRGTGAGSGLSGEGPGASKEGTGRGADTLAKNGISPFPGAGGAGNGTFGKPAMPGVSVHGGSNIVTLPSFGADGSVSPDPTRSSARKNQPGPGITVVGTSRSGGAFGFYGLLKGDKVYTIYIDTALGTAVMEYADPTSADHPYADDLVAPQPMRAEVPENLKPSRLVIACVLDRAGLIRRAQVLEGGGKRVATQVLASLPNWKFRPVFRGDQPIEVNAILGFDIDTR